MATVVSTRVPLGRSEAGRFTVIDDEDAERVLAHRWHLVDGYVGRNVTKDGKRVLELLHRALLEPLDPAILVDHANGDPLDNRRTNLRTADRSQNGANSRPNTGRRYKGVHFFARAHHWQAYIRVRGRRIHLGVFDTDRDAARAYNDAALIHFGEFARLNEIED